MGRSCRLLLPGCLAKWRGVAGADLVGSRFNHRNLIIPVPELGHRRINFEPHSVNLTHRPSFRKRVPGIKADIFAEIKLLLRVDSGLGRDRDRCCFDVRGF